MPKTYTVFRVYYCKVQADEGLCEAERAPDCEKCNLYLRWKSSGLTLKEWRDSQQP